MRPPGLCLALDIGGTKLAVALAGRGGELVFQDRIATPRVSDASALYGVVKHLCQLAAEAADAREIDVVGVGCGGPMTASGEAVSPLNIPAWRSFPLHRALQVTATELLGRPTPVFVDNDAKAIALAEGWLGAARGERNYLAMVVSTGVGGGIVLDGRLLEGAAGNAGHIGHVIVEPGGRKCACGARGCLEAEASGSAIAAMSGHPASEAPVEIIERTGALVGRAVASVANLLDLQLAVVGGSVALGFGTGFFRAAERELGLSASLDHSRDCRIVPAGLGETAPLIGAAAVGWRGLSS
ncbi:MAG: ROK family protein [Acidimicrobiales bacterium]